MPSNSHKTVKTNQPIFKHCAMRDHLAFLTIFGENVAYYIVLQEQNDDNTIILEGSKYKYYEVMYNDGTECDLTKAPRRITVQYICHESGRGDLYQIKETSTCEYNAVILIAELCQHPDFV